MKFIVDGMLEGLAKWLRFLGFETEILKGIKDLPSKENIESDSYFLTQSKKHFNRWPTSKKLLLSSNQIAVQLRILDDAFEIFSQIQFLTRCGVCNTVLNRVHAEFVRERIPLNVEKEFSSFLHCSGCDRIYWEGSHVRRMVDKLRRMGVPILLNDKLIGGENDGTS